MKYVKSTKSTNATSCIHYLLDKTMEQFLSNKYFFLIETLQNTSLIRLKICNHRIVATNAIVHGQIQSPKLDSNRHCNCLIIHIKPNSENSLSIPIPPFFIKYTSLPHHTNLVPCLYPIIVLVVFIVHNKSNMIFIFKSQCKFKLVGEEWLHPSSIWSHKANMCVILNSIYCQNL